MHCTFISDSVLRQFEDLSSIKVSKKLRSDRNRVKRLFMSMVGVSINHESRLSYECNHGTDLPGVLQAKDNQILIQNPSPELIKAHQGSHTVYQFYLDKFGRDSLDGKGLTLKSSVHYDKNYNNAFWNGEQMVYGDGDGKLFIPFVNAIDVIGHELSHGFIQNTCNLMYYGQPGAANESFADIFGVTIKQMVNNDLDPKTANWLVGDSIVGSDFPGKAIRSFKDEKAYKGDNQPKHMKKFVITIQDNGGVHTNSGILNHAFYNMCVEMNSPSFQKPIQVMYNTALNLNPISTFGQISSTAYKQAVKLYGKGSLEALAVKRAYKQVGL